MRTNLPVTGHEKFLEEGEFILSKADLKGNITVGSAIIKTDSDLFAPVSTEALAKFKSASQILFNAIQNGAIPSAMREDEYLVMTKQ